MAEDKLSDDARKHDDGLPWGWICEGQWRSLPKVPMLLAHLGPPPFTVKLTNGEVRHVIHNPNG